MASPNIGKTSLLTVGLGKQDISALKSAGWLLKSCSYERLCERPADSQAHSGVLVGVRPKVMSPALLASVKNATATISSMNVPIILFGPGSHQCAPSSEGKHRLCSCISNVQGFRPTYWASPAVGVPPKCGCKTQSAQSDGMLHTVCPRSPTEFSPALLSVARLLGSNVARRDQIGTISGETGAIRDPSLEERACVKPDSQTRPEDCLLSASQLPSPAAAPAVLTPPAPLIPPNAEPASAVQTA